MAQTLLLLTVLVCVVPSFQQLESLKPSETVSLGGTVTLPCRFSTGTISDGNYPWWLQQSQRGTPRAIIYTTSSRPSGIPARFSGSRSGNTMSLTITGVLAEDEADYYCAVWTGSEWVFGGGTQLIVTDANQPSLPPNVNLFPPSVEEKESKNKATLVCLMDGFRPPDITVTWLADGTAISTGVETTKPTKLNDNYVASSYLTLNPSEWESHTSYSCKVTHKGIDYTKSVGHSGSQCS